VWNGRRGYHSARWCAVTRGSERCVFVILCLSDKAGQGSASCQLAASSTTKPLTKGMFFPKADTPACLCVCTTLSPCRTWASPCSTKQLQQQSVLSFMASGHHGGRCHWPQQGRRYCRQQLAGLVASCCPVTPVCCVVAVHALFWGLLVGQYLAWCLSLLGVALDTNIAYLSHRQSACYITAHRYNLQVRPP
jgi:hypothetical protein